MSSESNFAYAPKYNTHFIVKNVCTDNRKTIKIFNYPINYGQTRDLLAIPGIDESDIRASILKGVLRHKFLSGDIVLVSSDINLLQFSDDQRAWLQSFGFTKGVQSGYDELDNYVQGLITGGGSGGITPQQHQILRQLIHFLDGGGPGTGFSSNTYREILPAASPFPTSVVWYMDNTKTKKIVEKIITYNSDQFPSTIRWNMYGTDGATIVESLVDTITYNGVFETSRVRSTL